LRRLDLTQLRLPATSEAYTATLATLLPGPVETPDENVVWNDFKKAVHVASSQNIGFCKHRRNPWISAETLAAVERRRKIFGDRINLTTAVKRQENASVRALIKHDKEVYWSSLADEVNQAYNRGKTSAVYQTLRRHSPRPGLSEVIKDLQGSRINDWDARLERWKDHFSGVLNQQAPTRPLLEADLELLAQMDVDTEPPTEEEVQTAINALRDQKAAGPDDIPAELLKAGGATLTQSLTRLLTLIWNNERLPSDWEDSILLPLHKKGSRDDCGNYRGITLLCSALKVLESVLLRRLRPAYESRLRENQAGFRPSRGTIDQIFSLRQVLEKRFEFRRPTLVAFIDFKAAFDSIDRTALFRVLKADGLPSKLVALIQTLYANTKCQIRAYGGLSDRFCIKSGVRQGALLSPLLFNILIDWVLRNSLREHRGVECLHGGGCVTDLDYADDLGILAESESELQDMVDKIIATGGKVGLKINASKTKVLSSCCPQPAIRIGNDTLENVTSFKYLGCQVYATADPSGEIGVRIARAQAAFTALNRELWSRREISIPVKLSVFLAIVRSTLLYGCETWPVKVGDIRRAEAFEMRCFRAILRISYHQHVSNREVLHRMGLSLTVSDDIKKRRLRWFGHVLRMSDERHPKGTCLFKPPTGPAGWRRPPGGLRKTWLSTVKQDLSHMAKTAYAPYWHRDWISLCMDLAQDRHQWKLITGRTT
jgi:hypothetical protein